MHEAVRTLISYLKILSKRWLTFFIFYLSIIGGAITSKLLNAEIPSWVFWTLALLGLFLAGFRVYKELLKQIHSEIKEEKKEETKKPELSIALLEGNEYSYKLVKSSEPKEEEGEYIPDNASAKLHLRIENTGNVGLDLILLEVNYEDVGFPWSFLLSFTYENEKKISFPKFLDKKEIFICEIQNNMHPKVYRNNAKFATSLSQLNEKSINVDFKIILEAKARDGSNEIFTCEYIGNVSLRPLIDLYITKWQEDSQQDLIRLSQPSRK